MGGLLFLLFPSPTALPFTTSRSNGAAAGGRPFPGPQYPYPSRPPRKKRPRANGRSNLRGENEEKAAMSARCGERSKKGEHAQSK